MIRTRRASGAQASGWGARGVQLPAAGSWPQERRLEVGADWRAKSMLLRSFAGPKGERLARDGPLLGPHVVCRASAAMVGTE